MTAAALRVVETETARDHLAQAIAAANAGLPEIERLGAQGDKARALIALESAARERLATLEREAAGAVSDYLADKADKVSLPNASEIEQARRDLADAVTVANAAKAALAEIEQQINHATAARLQAQRDLKAMVIAVVLEQAHDLRMQQLEAESRVADVTRQINAIRTMLLKMGGADSRAVEGLRQAADPMRDRQEASAFSDAKLTEQWRQFADRLFTDANATEPTK